METDNEMEMEPVYCPYCGKQMELKTIGDRYYYYSCRHNALEENLDNTDEMCAADGPIAKRRREHTEKPRPCTNP